MQCVKTPKYLCDGFYNLIFKVRARVASENALNDLEVEIEIIVCPSRVHKGASDESQPRPNYLLISE